MNIKQLWSLVLEDIQVGLSKGNFATWIKPTLLEGIKEVGEDRLIAEISCPSSFHLQMVEGRYYGQIKEALDKATKKKSELRFSVNTQLQQEKPIDSSPLFASTSQPTIDELSVAQHRIGLNEQFVFDTFAVSTSNEMAHAAAVAVSKKLGGSYNPLFLYGGVGVGKTHLMQAIANSSLNESPRTLMVYCAGEEFTNEIIDAIQQKRTREFKKKYRSVKGLFIDDIQFIAGKNTVQEEFFHTFNAVTKSGGQVVMTSDKPPHEINNLEARLRSRFEAGLLIDIGDPSFELRTAILLIKSRQKGLDLPMDAARAIAAHVDSARKLEGFLVRLATESRLRGHQITIDLVQSILGKRTEAPITTPIIVRPLEVIRAISKYYDVSVKELRGPRRNKNIVLGRQLAMYIMRFDLKLALTDIGGMFGGRDHTTVMHGVDKMTKTLTDSESLRLDLTNVRKSLQN
ncbi:chromosomal replication initiator protein DnaA [Patescibacteria group bacterium]